MGMVCKDAGRALVAATACHSQKGRFAFVCAGCSREEARRLLVEAGMQPPLLAKPLWADGRDGAHGLAVIHEVPKPLLHPCSQISTLGAVLQGHTIVVLHSLEHGQVMEVWSTVDAWAAAVEHGREEVREGGEGEEGNKGHEKKGQK